VTDTVSRLTTALADRYRIESELGQGGMATVYLAEDVRHRRKVALKVLHPELSAVLGSERFLKEIELTANLQHPHNLPLFDSGSADGQLFYVMPFVQGETLRGRLERERQLPVLDAVRLAREVAEALQYAHERGVIHRDIKPENILLQGGHALVADFGIALAVQHAGGQRMTQTGLSLGTPQYMAPEQALGEKSVDARADVYALGAVTYEMLSGEAPFTGPTAQSIIARVMSEDPRPLAMQRKSIPEHVEAAVLHALEKLPADRFASAAEFAVALDAGATSTRTYSSRAVRPPSRAPIIVLGALVAASAALAAWGWLRPTPDPEVVRYRIVIDSVPAVKDWTGEVAISPDGEMIIRSGGPGGALLVRHRDEVAFSPLAGTEGASGPFFSPDGTRIGYYMNGALMAVPLGGGPPTVIADSLVTPEAVSWGVDGYLYRTLLKDGVYVIARSEPRPGAPLEPITTVDTTAGELTHLHSDLLPDGKTLLFQVASRGGKLAIGVAELGNSKHRILVEGARARYAPSGHLLYTTIDGKLWAVPFDSKTRTISGAAVQVADRIPSTIVGPIDFAVSATGTLVYSVEDASSRRELTWVSRTGARIPFDSTWKREFASPSLSADGSRVAVSIREGGQSDVWIKTIGGGAAQRLTAGQRQSSVEPAWTPDGRAVTYLSGDASTGDVWSQRVDGGSAAERLVRSQRRPISEQVWSPLGNALLVRTTTSTAGSGDILVAHPGADTVQAALVATPRAEYSPAVSPDGKWLAYVSNETGRFEVYVIPFATPSAAKWAISTTGGNAPRWSHKGDELFYLDTRSNMVAAHVTTTPNFAVQSTRVLFNASDFIQTSISRRNYDVSADDQRFLMVQRADNAKRGQLVVVEHWTDEIRRKTATPGAVKR
jgi:serine/threonine-protein kinase